MAKRRPLRTTIGRARSTLLWGVAGFGLLVAALIAYTETAGRAPSATAATIGGPFELVDQNGQAVTDATYRGKWLLIYFGYTHCPDACPTALSDMAEALEGLGAQRPNVQPLFITIDPERDTPGVLKEYTASFQADIVGLTGSVQQIAAAAKQFQVYYRREKGSDPDYAMAHSSGIYLLDPAERFVTHFSHETAPETIRARLLQALS